MFRHKYIKKWFRIRINYHVAAKSISQNHIYFDIPNEEFFVINKQQYSEHSDAVFLVKPEFIIG